MYVSPSLSLSMYGLDLASSLAIWVVGLGIGCLLVLRGLAKSPHASKLALHLLVLTMVPRPLSGVFEKAQVRSHL